MAQPPLLRREPATRRDARAGPGADLLAMKIRDTATETKVPEELDPHNKPVPELEILD